MIYLIILIFLCYIIYLIKEFQRVKSYRQKFEHVIYVNGTRGKSTITRLIDAGLRNGGYKVFSKTTGTVPIYINTNNEEVPIRRWGPANIKEQITMMKKAYNEDADILVLECMAVDPELQHVSQNQMVKSNIGVISNVRLDHTDVMGADILSICESLSNTIPREGVLFTGEVKLFDQLKENTHQLNSKIYQSQIRECFSDQLFPINYSIALDVCEYIGVPRTIALNGMKTFKHDPYSLSIYKLNDGTIFINALSVNDITSYKIVYSKLEKEYGLHEKNMVLLINNRPDRGYRAEHMVDLANDLNPSQIILMGAFSNILKSKIKNNNINIIYSTKDLNLDLGESYFIFAVGNIANFGDKIIDKVKSKGELIAR